MHATLREWGAEQTTQEGLALSQPVWQQLKKSTKNECKPPVRSGAWQDCSKKQWRKLLGRTLVQPLITSPFAGCWHGQSCKVEEGRLETLALTLLSCVLLLADKLVFWYW